MSQIPPLPPIQPQLVIQGAYQDGRRLVVHTHAAQLPAYCVKTNEADPGLWHPLKLEWVPNAVMWAVLGGAIGMAIAKSMTGKKVQLSIPIKPEVLARHKSSYRIGWGLICGGLFLFILGIFGFALTVDQNESASMALGIAGGAGILLTLIGVIFMLVMHRPLLKVWQVRQDYAWLDGAHPEFLAALPQWPH